MNNIIDFPTDFVRGWAPLESTILEILDENSATNRFKSEVITRMRKAYDEHQFSHPISYALPEEFASEINDQLSQFMSALQEQTSKLLFSRLVLEIELATAKGL